MRDLGPASIWKGNCSLFNSGEIAGEGDGEMGLVGLADVFLSLKCFTSKAFISTRKVFSRKTAVSLSKTS